MDLKSVVKRPSQNNGKFTKPHTSFFGFSDICLSRRHDHGFYAVTMSPILLLKPASKILRFLIFLLINKQYALQTETSVSISS